MTHAFKPGRLVLAGIAIICGPVRGPSARGQTTDASAFLVVLGIAQDGGFPQAGCPRSCCREAWREPGERKHVACLGLVDPETNDRWLIDATPDLREQLRALDVMAPPASPPGLSGILLTHGHIGHYTGLMQLGHESMGARGVPVYVMSRMRGFLTENGPWDQLVRYGNVELRDMAADVATQLGERIRVTPMRVPHREEYTEVVGFRIQGPNRSALYLPDIDKWELWEHDIETLIGQVDVAWLDGTFFADGEVPGRDASAIPHPLISESLERFGSMPAAQRSKIRFIHLNHTNPAMRPDSTARRAIEAAGFRVAREGEQFPI